MHRLMIVEDDKPIRDELRILLERNGYEAMALECFDGIVPDVLESGADLVLLDLNLPGVDGHYICRQLREKSSLPIIVVTSSNTDADELLSMNFGADDFVAKPYNTQILLARIAAVLKRSYGSHEASLSCRGLVVDPARCTVSYGGQTAELTKNELKIITMLVRDAGTVVTRQHMQEELWSTDEFVDDNTLTVNVSHLRRTLESIGAGGFVRTKRGMGYMLS